MAPPVGDGKTADLIRVCRFSDVFKDTEQFHSDFQFQGKSSMKRKNITGILFFISTALCASPETINYNFQLSEAEKEWLGRKIFKNECDSNFECLTTWNKGEEFPSLGIGHFIWYLSLIHI